MKKIKLFTLLIIIILVLFLAVAASCNFCGISMGLGEENSSSENSALKDPSEQSSLSNEIDEPPESDEQGQSPTIELKINDGPIYSPEDDVCFYKIEAVVSGDPLPEKVEFSRNDSDAWGPYIAQINLTREEPNYILTASVSTSNGTDSDSMELNWNCDGENNGSEEVISQDIDENNEQQSSESLEPENNPPAINSVKLVELATGKVIEVGETTNGIRGGYDYRVVIEATDPDGDELSYFLKVNVGIFSIESGNHDMWSYNIWTPPEPGDQIIIKDTLTLTVSDEEGLETTISSEVFITN